MPYESDGESKQGILMWIKPKYSHEIVLCSADAGPGSQRKNTAQAQYFFPGAKWVDALRNAAGRLGCDFLILTTQHGLVEPRQIISPYDLHINVHRQAVTEKWFATIPPLVSGREYKLMIFYAGGCPRDEMIEVMLPIMQQQGVAILTFGRPHMCDVDKAETIWKMVTKGTTDSEIKSILGVPERFEYYPATNIGLNRA
jgi:hypothetical protein